MSLWDSIKNNYMPDNEDEDEGEEQELKKLSELCWNYFFQEKN